MNQKAYKSTLFIYFVSVLTIVLALTMFWFWTKVQNSKPVIESERIHSVSAGTTEGSNLSSTKSLLVTTKQLEFVSEEIDPGRIGANAAVLTWGQTGNNGVLLQMRTNNNGTWSRWIEVSNPDERKDDEPAPNTALIIGDKIRKVQYRFKLTGAIDQPSASVDLSQATLDIIDTTRGPSPGSEPGVVEKILGYIGLNDKVSARMDGPRIFSRQEWGSPQPNSSPGWTPQYAPLGRAIVHHTAIPQGADPAASIRAIWQYHTYNNGWGDIGYNYLVDQQGNIYQGRYFNAADAAASGGEVVAGHAYQNNIGTTGVAALGDFTSVRVPDVTVSSIADIIAFKAANYKFNPSGIGGNGPNVVGHRHVTSTSCPGQRLHDRLGDIRAAGDAFYLPRVAMNRYDLTNNGQGFGGNPSVSTTMKAGETKTAYFDLKNQGDEPWRNYGSNPVLIGTDAARDRPSIFNASSWVNSSRPATFENRVEYSNGGAELVPATEIKPGEVGRFAFDMKAPLTARGVYTERFQLVVEGREWFTRNLLLSNTIHVSPAIYSWRPVAQQIFTDETLSTSSDTNMEPGERVYLVLKAQNTGNMTWKKEGQSPAIRLATSNTRDRKSSFCDSSWISCTRASTFTEDQVAPGDYATFGFWIKIPSPSRNFIYYDHYSLVADGVTWMNTEPGVNWPIVVQNN